MSSSLPLQNPFNLFAIFADTPLLEAVPDALECFGACERLLRFHWLLQAVL